MITVSQPSHDYPQSGLLTRCRGLRPTLSQSFGPTIGDYTSGSAS